MEIQAKLHIQDQIQKKQPELAASYMLRYECGQNPYEMRRRAIMQFVDTHTAAYVGLGHKGEIEPMAAEIMNTGIKYKDACHVASAIYNKCKRFISTDKRLLKYQTDRIRLVTPIEFVAEMEDE